MLNGGFSHRYGVWVEKNLRIVSETGERVRGASVVERNVLPGCEKPRAFAVDRGGRVALRCYAQVGVTLSVSAPGYYGRSVFVGPGKDEDVVLRRKVRPHQMRTRRLRLSLPEGTPDDAWRVDLVEGDWLPPHGFGRVADVAFRRADKGGGLSSVGCMAQVGGGEMQFLREDDGFGFVGNDSPDELGTPYEVDDAICTNRLCQCPPYGYANSNVVFRVRGHYGVFLGVPRISLSKVYGRKQKAADAVEVSFEVAVNAEAGERGLERLNVSDACMAAPPVRHEVPPDGANMLAFGVSPDGRGAVCFGRPAPGIRVPDMFSRAVYTSEPARDLEAVETLYLDIPHGTVPARALAGLPSLRSVVCLSQSSLRIDEEAFAGCGRLNAVLFPQVDVRYASSHSSPVVAENAFAGCAKDVSALFFKADLGFGSDGPAGGSVVSCTNVWTKQYCVPLPADRYARSPLEPGGFFAPQVDFARGNVDIPQVRFDGRFIEREDGMGRVVVLDVDGHMERRVK